MNDSSILDGYVQITQCEEAAYALDQQIATYTAVQTTFNEIASDTELSGETADQIRTQMLDYADFIGAAISANEGDIEQFATALSALKSFYYYGADIHLAQQTALSQKASDEAERDRCYDEYWNRWEIFSSDYYYLRYLHYKKQVQYDQEDYDYWCSVEKEYDTIDAATSGLFASTGVRDAINRAIEALPSNFIFGNYDVSQNETLKNNIEKAFKASWTKDGSADPYKLDSRIRRAENLQSLEYKALVSDLNDEGITVPESTAPSDLSKVIIQLMDTDIASNRNPDGTYVKNPFDTLGTDTKRILYVSAYESFNEEDALKMSFISSQFAVEGYEGWQEDLNNIKFLVYTADEPFKSFYLNGASGIVINDFEYKDTQYFSSSILDYGVHIDVDKMDQAAKGAAAYTTFFHECTHEIDYECGSFFDSYSKKYKDADGKSFTDILKVDVEGKIDMAFYCNLLPSDRSRDMSDVRKAVRDNIMNEVDYLTYGAPDITDPEVSYYYNVVVNYINADMNKYTNPNTGANYGSDVYGGMSGNTLFASFGHPATTDHFQSSTDKKGRLYWVVGSINKDGSGMYLKMADGTKSVKETYNVISDYDPAGVNGTYKSDFDEKIIAMDADVQYTSAATSEYVAEYVAANITNDPDEKKSFEFFDSKTNDYANAMIASMAN